ncbi:hypothetical protein BDY17DRAFT_291399 [Neohortaea acidophila]|uniref:DUF7719 domain-containing protein n=1 Tax=Neohortaea acidophila TaxID=245834 RepID=A0A6A6Q401_9PEZI|nr:uncharacterized protein BDY17DRAFT_291399 [Neohortaea acidophila]KAF2486383.1 hypothetical protein BDY17DRAFT_291399 [Neohortaea acidophila]
MRKDDSRNGSEKVTTSTGIHLQQPDRSRRKGKTLLEIHEERKVLQRAVAQKLQSDPVHDEDGTNVESIPDDEGEIGPIADATFWSIILATLHFTLDVLVYSQYRQEIEWTVITKRTITMIIPLFVLVLLLRSSIVRQFPLPRQIFFLIAGTISGCYVIYAANVYGYYAVMKQAPPLGTLWIWSVIEMDLPFAVASVAFDLGYVWFKQYSVY